MAAKKVGELIKEARTKAGLSQTALAALIEGVSASDIGKAERGEKELSQAALKAIAKATGVTQKSLLEAPKGGTGSTTAAKTSSTAAKTSSTAAKTGSTAAKTSSTAAKTGSTTAKKTSSSTAKKTSSSTAKKTSTTAEELTSAEKTLLNAYRKADADTRKAALKLLKGEKDEDILSTLIQSFMGSGSGGGSGSGALGGGLMELLGNLGKK